MPGRNRFSLRLNAATALLAVGAVAVLGRMVELTVVHGEQLRREVDNIICDEAKKISYRGPILDRNGAALATSVAAYRVAVRRQEYRYDRGDAARLAPLLDRPVDKLDRTLRDDPRPYIFLNTNMGIDAANGVRRLRTPGIDIDANYQRRTYPQGPLAAHLVGFSGSDATGLEGIERALDQEIRGTPITVQVCRDVRNRVFVNESDQSGIVRGSTVRLTIDATLQAIAEAELNAQVEAVKAVGGTVVIMDPRTGEILAMANAPAFDPNRFAQEDAAARRNRSVTDVFEPGSTAKALVVAAALDAGVIKPQDKFFCENGAMRIGRWTIHDHHKHAWMTVPEILQVSSNICTAKIGMMLGAERLGTYLQAFGLGRVTGAQGLLGEVPGIVSSWRKWPEIRIANVSFGQGLSVTAVQLAAAFATLANGGVRMKPYVVQSVQREDGSVVIENAPHAEGAVIAPEVARRVSEMLVAVTQEGGTAPKAAIEGIRVAGKTGTAQKAVGGRYSNDHWLSSFVGYLPADDPRLVIAVAIDEPQENHFGGIVAAPVFKRVAETTLDYLSIHREPKPDATPPRLEPVDAVRTPRPSVAAFDGTMPNLLGLSLRRAAQALGGCDCDLRIEGHGYVVAQQPSPGSVLARASAVSLTLDSAAATN
jgi:cell division protein FtsI (penicillin-binding protein 3)